MQFHPFACYLSWGGSGPTVEAKRANSDKVNPEVGQNGGIDGMVRPSRQQAKVWNVSKQNQAPVTQEVKMQVRG